MKNFLIMLGCFLAITPLLNSCEDDDNTTVTNPPTAQEFNLLRQNALNSATQTFTFDASSGPFTFTSSNGVQLTINGNCLLRNGNPVTGNVTVSYIELFDAGSMLVTDKTTMGRLPGGDLSLLISGGSFNIRATQGTDNLTLTCPMQAIIPVSLTGGADTEMTLWTGTINEDGNLEWDEEPRDEQGGVFVEGNSYYTTFGNFGWTNVDRFYSDPRPRTTILVGPPTGYNNTNSAVYLKYVGEPNALAKLDTYDPVTQQFSEHYGQIPIGLQCHVIFTTEEAGQWRYAIKSVTIGAGDVYNFNLSETVLGSEAQLVAAIDALP